MTAGHRCLRIVSSVLKEAEVAVEDVDEVILVGGSTRIPVLRSKISELFHDKVCVRRWFLAPVLN